MTLARAQRITIHLYDAARVEIGDEATDLDVRGTSGSESIHVFGRLIESTIHEADMSVSGVIDGLDGLLGELRCEPGATIAAGRIHDWGSRALSVRTIDVVEASDLSGFDVFRCRNADVAALESAARVEVWLPMPMSRALAEVERMVDMTAAQRAYFWTRISVLAREKSAAGSYQPQTRYLAAELRRRASAGREKTLLNAYRVVGYGERIGRPLALFLAAVLLVAIVFTIGVSSDASGFVGAWWSYAWRLMISPLTFFLELTPSTMMDLSTTGVDLPSSRSRSLASRCCCCRFWLHGEC